MFWALSSVYVQIKFKSAMLIFYDFLRLQYLKIYKIYRLRFFYFAKKEITTVFQNETI